MNKTVVGMTSCTTIALSGKAGEEMFQLWNEVPAMGSQHPALGDYMRRKNGLPPTFMTAEPTEFKEVNRELDRMLSMCVS